MSIIDLILLSMPLIRYGGPSLWRAVTDTITTIPRRRHLRWL